MHVIIKTFSDQCCYCNNKIPGFLRSNIVLMRHEQVLKIMSPIKLLYWRLIHFVEIVFFLVCFSKFAIVPSPCRASQVALAVKNLPANSGDKRDVGSTPALEDSLEGMAAHSSIAWRIPLTEEPGGLQSMGSQSVGHSWSSLARMRTSPCRALILSVYCLGNLTMHHANRQM